MFREYAKSKGQVAKAFVRLKSEPYDVDVLETKDDDGGLEVTLIDYKELVFWLLRKYSMKEKE